MSNLLIGIILFIILTVIVAAVIIWSILSAKKSQPTGQTGQPEQTEQTSGQTSIQADQQPMQFPENQFIPPMPVNEPMPPIPVQIPVQPPVQIPVQPYVSVVRCTCGNAACPRADMNIAQGNGAEEIVPCGQMGNFTSGNGWTCVDTDENVKNNAICCTDANPCPKFTYVPPPPPEIAGRCVPQAEIANNPYYIRECAKVVPPRCVAYAGSDSSIGGCMFQPN